MIFPSHPLRGCTCEDSVSSSEDENTHTYISDVKQEEKNGSIIAIS